jgi:ketose-bisphosphate aldolase
MRGINVMTLVNMKKILEDARRHKYAVAAFDVSNYDMAAAVIEVAEELKAPVILMGIKLDLEENKIDYWMSSLKIMAEKAYVPVCIHLDHAVDFEFIKRAIEKGFTSVMYDGSILSLEENIKQTKIVVDYAHKYGVTVEAELGHVGNGNVGNSEVEVESDKNENDKDLLTNSDEMERFINKTGVDALAVAIGTVHGAYIKKPELDFERLKRLNELSSVPLVMHGGSNTPDEAVKKSIELGICKLNVFSEILAAFFTSLKEVLNNRDNMAVWPSIAYKQPIITMKEVVRKKIILTGSDGRV